MTISKSCTYFGFTEGKWEEKKCGRPLGMRFSPADGNLIVVDAYYGLFSVDVDKGIYSNNITRLCSSMPAFLIDLGTCKLLVGTVKALVSSNETIDGKSPMIPNDLDVAQDGTVYWSDSSTHSYLQDSLDEFLGEPSGR